MVDRNDFESVVSFRRLFHEAFEIALLGLLVLFLIMFLCL